MGWYRRDRGRRRSPHLEEHHTRRGHQGRRRAKEHHKEKERHREKEHHNREHLRIPEQEIHSHLEQGIRNQEHRRIHQEPVNRIHPGHRNREIHQKAETRREDENQEEEGEGLAEEPPTGCGHLEAEEGGRKEADRRAGEGEHRIVAEEQESRIVEVEGRRTAEGQENRTAGEERRIRRRRSRGCLRLEV
ncbi:hypothetical protein HG530_009722 [Fusarium avenaceum]|nr:hypothetical protein HG530_009722 [Fusarium avenaceum]